MSAIFFTVQRSMNSRISCAVRFAFAKVGNSAHESAKVATLSIGASGGIDRHTKFITRGSTSPSPYWERTLQTFGASSGSMTTTTASAGSIISRGTASKPSHRRATGETTKESEKILRSRRTRVSAASWPPTLPALVS